ncbi:MAG: ribonuclease J [Candidatus Taylorbacteria bacterium]|nr:ribonuclease J [Candidatus Taylorbacteria bacterium]
MERGFPRKTRLAQRRPYSSPHSNTHHPEIRTFIADENQANKKPARVGSPSHHDQGHRGRQSSAFRTAPARRNVRPQRLKTDYSTPLKQTESKKSTKTIPPPLGDTIRIIPLGGVEEIGRNMTLIEYRNDIIVVDAGLQFSEEDTPGIDFILPNTKYLEERKDKIRALLVTHGHLDHIGAIPYIMDRIGNPPMYTRKLTALMIEKRQFEFPSQPKLDIRIVEKNEAVRIGDLKIRFFSVTHTIPDAMGIIIETPYGLIVTPGDFKLSHENGVVDAKEDEEYSTFDKENVLMMMADSTNIENPGFSTPERLVHKTLEDIITKTNTRLIVGTFASQFERMIKVIQIAEATGKKIIIEGRSMKTNIDVAQAAGLIKPKKDTIIPTEDADNYPPNKIVVLATGAQGEEFAALMRMANKTHKAIHIKKGDTVVLSSSIIPGNEKTVEKLKDNLSRAGARVIHYRTSDVYIHSTGHANRGEVEWLHKKIKPKFFMPVHGNHYRLKSHEELAIQCGTRPENIVVPDDGTIVEIRNKGESITTLKEKAAEGFMMVDGFAVGDVQEVVIRDRQMLAEDGMFVIVASINTSTGRLKKSPDIISRGFVYLRESQELLQQTRIIIKKTVEDTTQGMNPINFEYVKSVLTDNIARFLFQKTNKRPIVIPVLIGV